MKGTVHVTISNNALRYQFEIRRNITIIRGDSASGKTTLVDMIREYDENGEQSGITLQCESPCVVVEGKRWDILLSGIHESVVFIDEGNLFILSDDFANAVKGSDNYFVLVTRESLPNLPYSVEEIYGIKASGKYGGLRQTYQEFYHIYGEYHFGLPYDPEVVIVEDSNAGFEFFDSYSQNKTWTVESSCGKSNIFATIKRLQDKRLLVIADGAAFGSEMDRIFKIINSKNGVALYLPESFEWLVLQSKLFEDKAIKKILEHPEDHIESKEYMSWERFFTAVLTDKTKGTYLYYTKSKLNNAYKNPKIQDKIAGVIPEGLL